MRSRRSATADRGRPLRRGDEAALAVIATDPLRESAHRALIRVHLAEGNIGEALRQYAFFRRLSTQLLGLDPSPEMEQLIGRGDAAVTAG